MGWLSLCLLVLELLFISLALSLATIQKIAIKQRFIPVQCLKILFLVIHLESVTNVA